MRFKRTNVEEIGIYGKTSTLKAEIKGCIKANNNGAVDPTIF